MLELCLFDLDNTLVKTDDLEDIRAAFANNADPTRLEVLATRLASGGERRVYSYAVLAALRQRFPRMRLGVFTRAPRSYTNALLNWAYPGFVWDVVVVYEDLGPRTKPYGYGILLAMQRLQLEDVQAVALVGDNDADVKSAYNAGCLAAVDRRAWPQRNRAEHWEALNLVPDAFIDEEQNVFDFVTEHRPLLPNLEHLIDGGAMQRAWRYDRLGYFPPHEVEDRPYPYHISVAGRSFSNHGSVQARRVHHRLSASIEANKNSAAFPGEWIEAIQSFIHQTFETFFYPKDLVVTVVPHRPKRVPRLERLLDQLAASIVGTPLQARVTCVPGLLAYTEGVLSHHQQFLTRVQRFRNVRDHLIVSQPSRVSGDKVYLVIDDVVTAGASLIYAQKRLEEAGATDVRLLGLGKNIGDIYRRT